MVVLDPRALQDPRDQEEREAPKESLVLVVRRGLMGSQVFPANQGLQGLPDTRPTQDPTA